MCRSVSDAATILSVIAGRDPRDPYTLAQPSTVPDYLQALEPHALKDVRIGIPRALLGDADANVVTAFNATLDIIRNLGATIVDPADLPGTEEFLSSAPAAEDIVLMADFKVRITLHCMPVTHFATGRYRQISVRTPGGPYGGQNTIRPHCFQ